MYRFLVEFNIADPCSITTRRMSRTMGVDANNVEEAIRAVRSAYPNAVITGCVRDNKPMEPSW